MTDTPRVLLTLENGNIIAARRYSWLSGGLIGIAAVCDDGSKTLFCEKANPTYGEFYGIEVAQSSSYAVMKAAVEAATDWTYDDDLPWIEQDEHGDIVPETASSDRILGWLNTELNTGADLDLLERWGERTASEYAPGFAFMASLSDEERKRLGLREGGLGGPASSVPCVLTSASVEQLNSIIAEKALPYVFVDVQGPEEV